MSVWQIVALAVGVFYIGVAVGLLAAGMCQSARRGGTLDLTGLRNVHVVTYEPVHGLPDPDGLPEFARGGYIETSRRP